MFGLIYSSEGKIEYIVPNPPKNIDGILVDRLPIPIEEYVSRGLVTQEDYQGLSAYKMKEEL